VRFRAVVFDLFGTLVDNFPPSAYRRMVRKLATIVGADGGSFLGRWGETVRNRMAGESPTVAAGIANVCAGLGVSASERSIAEAAAVRVEFTRRHLAPREGTLETLDALRSKGLKRGLVTNCSMEVPAIWLETPLAVVIDAAVFSCIARTMKPGPRIYEMACEALSVQPHECLYVGDGADRELAGAARVGMAPLLLRVPGDDPKEWGREEAAEWEGPFIRTLAQVLTHVV
jgi:putative hydrolase of the HAD superfamily